MKEALTRSLDKGIIVLVSKKRVRKFTEELFEETGYTVHVMKEVLRNSEINTG